MANVKISALSSLSSISDTTVLPVVDSGTTQKTTTLALKNYATQAISANLGAYQTWANVNLGGGGSTYSNANVQSFLTTLTTPISTTANITSGRFDINVATRIIF